MFTAARGSGGGFIDGVLRTSAHEGELKPGGRRPELLEHVGEGDSDHLSPLHPHTITQTVG